MTEEDTFNRLRRPTFERMNELLQCAAKRIQRQINNKHGRPWVHLREYEAEFDYCCRENNWTYKEFLEAERKHYERG